MTFGTKPTWVTRRVPAGLRVSWGSASSPRVGDLLLCEVVSLGLHSRLEGTAGNRSRLYPGDQIVCAVGNRYATAMLEGVAAIDGESCDLLSASGVCGRVIERNDGSSKATTLKVLAQAFVDGQPMNLGAFTMGRAPKPVNEPAWLVVVGSAMDSGKTTAAASLIHGLSKTGRRVGAAKITGTASSRDVTSMRDAGADPVYDFLDMGFPSTAGMEPHILEGVLAGLAAHLRNSGIDVAVLEIADGLLQTETDHLLGLLPRHLGAVGVILTTCESLSAAAGVVRLETRGLEVLATSGVLSSSPLARREAELASGVPCIRTRELGTYVAGTSWALPVAVPAPVASRPTG